MDNTRQKTQELTMWGNTLNLLVSKSIKVYKLFITKLIAKLKNKTKGIYLITLISD